MNIDPYLILIQVIIDVYSIRWSIYKAYIDWRHKDNDEYKDKD